VLTYLTFILDCNTFWGGGHVPQRHDASDENSFKLTRRHQRTAAQSSTKSSRCRALSETWNLSMRHNNTVSQFVLVLSQQRTSVMSSPASLLAAG